MYKLLFGFPAPIVFALLINELAGHRYKKIVPTVSYLPHFMSWVVVGGIFSSLLSLDGPINSFMAAIGLDKVMFMGSKSVFRSVLVTTDIWKGFGWGSILYLAAIAGVDQEMYEASRIDGANKFQNAWYITIPSILSVICINLILSLSGILNAGFDQIFNMYSAVVYEVADIIDTYVYRLGLANMQSTAYSLLLDYDLIWITYRNTIVRCIIGTSLSVFFTAMTAYPLSKREMPFQGLLTNFILITMLFGGGLIPSYILVKDLPSTYAKIHSTGGSAGKDRS